MLLDQLGESDGSLDMGHPVEIDAEGPALRFLISFSASYFALLSILYAMLMILTLSPYRSRYSERLAKPIGYISKIGVEGITSLMGPCRTESFRKSYTLGG